MPPPSRPGQTLRPTSAASAVPAAGSGQSAAGCHRGAGGSRAAATKLAHGMPMPRSRPARTRPGQPWAIPERSSLPALTSSTFNRATQQVKNGRQLPRPGRARAEANEPSQPAGPEPGILCPLIPGYRSPCRNPYSVWGDGLIEEAIALRDQGIANERRRRLPFAPRRSRSSRTPVVVPGSRAGTRRGALCLGLRLR